MCVCVYCFSNNFLPGDAIKCLPPAVFILVCQDCPSWLGNSVVLWLFMLTPGHYVANLQHHYILLLVSCTDTVWSLKMQGLTRIWLEFWYAVSLAEKWVEC